MAKTGCECGVGLRNTYSPAGVEWRICPVKDAMAILSENPDIELLDMFFELEDKLYEGDCWAEGYRSGDFTTGMFHTERNRSTTVYLSMRS